MARPTRRDVHVDTYLTNVSIAYRNTMYIAGGVLPNVPVTKISDKFPIYDKQSWMLLRDRGHRAPGTRAARVDYSISSGSYVCQEYAYSKGLPDEVRQNSDNPITPERTAGEFVTDVALLALEFRVAELVSASANWKNAAAPSPTWDDATSDPVSDIDTGRATVIKEIGRMPNVLVMGYEVWQQLKNHPDLLDRIKHTQRGVLTTELAAAIFEVEKLLVGSAVYDSAEEAATASQGFIWGKSATLLYVPATPSLLVPSAGYTFEFMSFTTARYREDQEKQDVFEVAHSTDEVITGSDAAYNFASAVA